jgi:hypothetical protein
MEYKPDERSAPVRAKRNPGTAAPDLAARDASHRLQLVRATGYTGFLITNN